MAEAPYSKLEKRILRLRWQAPFLALFLVIAHQIIEHTWLADLPHWQHFTSQVLFYGLVGPVLAWIALTSLRNSVAETEAAERALKKAHGDLQRANTRLEFLIKVNRRLSEAEDEEALLGLMLALPQEVVPAYLGCSLVRYDDRQQPAVTLHQGDLSPDVFGAWETHLSSANARAACEHCATHCATDSENCPLFLPANKLTPVEKVFCLELSCGPRKYGALNVYLSDAAHPTENEAALLDALAVEMSLALESHHLRTREIATLFRLQEARRTKNLYAELEEALEHLTAAFEVEGGLLFLTEENTLVLKTLAMVGYGLDEELELVKGLAGSAFQTLKPFIIRDLSQENKKANMLRSLLIAPLRTEEDVLGALVLWSAQPDQFARRHIRLVGTVAGQAALLLENHRLYLRAEHQAALAERARLGREIHDGLAQTLSYIQLRLAQMKKSLTPGEHEHFGNDLNEVQDLVDEAYLDARDAIDALRPKPDQGTLSQWVTQALISFREADAFHVSTNEVPEVALPITVQVQLLRIIQEALENARKHSDCSQVWLQWGRHADELVLSISDDGRGFDPEAVVSEAHHGLKIMRERADLIDADFQIAARPGEGTQVMLRLPVSDSEGARR